VLARSKLGALGHNHNTEVASTGVAHANFGCNFIYIERLFGDQNYVSAAGDAAVNRNPTGVAAHDFNHHHATVRLSGCMYTINRFSDHVHGGVEPECEISARQ